MTSYKKPESSPFVIQQIGTKLKSIFGNIFKTQDKLNKSYEEQIDSNATDLKQFTEQS